jgi:hypothetical protein
MSVQAFAPIQSYPWRSAVDCGVYERQNLGYNCGTADTVFCDRFDR